MTVKRREDWRHCEGQLQSEVSRRAFLAQGCLGALAVGLAGCSARASNAATAGCNELPDRVYTESLSGNRRSITANGIPNHGVGNFPNDNCPTAISAITRTYSITSDPQQNAELTPLNGWLFGIAYSGVPFDPTGPFWSLTAGNVWELEVMATLVRPYLGLDGNNAHVQTNGEYHYHGIPNELITILQPDNIAKSPVQIGWAADGFPIFGPYGYADQQDTTSGMVLLRSSYQLKEGQRPSGGPKGEYDGTFVEDYLYLADSGDLDECNGRLGVVPGFPQGIYHYHISPFFPFVSRYYRGTPDQSFSHPSPGLADSPLGMIGT